MSEKSTKESILETATQLFGKRGVKGVSTATIAREAGVNKALIFYYFGSKDDLYKAVFCNFIKTLRDHIERALDNVEPGLPTIETFVRLQIQFFSRNSHLFNLFSRELLINLSNDNDEPSPLILEIGEIMKPFREKMLLSISAARINGDIRDIDPIQTMVNIISLNIFFFMGKPLIQVINPMVDLEKFQEQRVEHVIDLLLNGLSTHNTE